MCLAAALTIIQSNLYELARASLVCTIFDSLEPPLRNVWPRVTVYIRSARLQAVMPSSITGILFVVLCAVIFIGLLGKHVCFQRLVVRLHSGNVVFLPIGVSEGTLVR